MEKAFKIFVCVMAAVLIGWIVYSIVDTGNKHEESIRKSNEVFARAWKESNTGEELKKIGEDIGRIADDYKETTDKILRLMAEMNAAMERGDTEEADRIMEEIRKLNPEKDKSSE